MSNYTDKDRERSVETFTMLKAHIKHNDERYGELKTDVADIEIRLRKNESFRYKLIGWAVGAGIISAGGAELLKAKIGL